VIFVLWMDSEVSDPKIIMCKTVVNRVRYSTAKWQTPNAISPSSDMLISAVFHGEVKDSKQYSAGSKSFCENL